MRIYLLPGEVLVRHGEGGIVFKSMCGTSSTDRARDGLPSNVETERDFSSSLPGNGSFPRELRSKRLEGPTVRPASPFDSASDSIRARFISRPGCSFSFCSPSRSESGGKRFCGIRKCEGRGSPSSERASESVFVEEDVVWL